MNHEFLMNWEPEVIKPKAEESTCAGVSDLCQVCKNLDEECVCSIRGFDMQMAPKVYACLEWEAKASMCQGKVEMMLTFTVEVTQILRVGLIEAARAEEALRSQSVTELEHLAAAVLGAENAKVRDLKVWVMDK